MAAAVQPTLKAVLAILILVFFLILFLLSQRLILQPAAASCDRGAPPWRAPAWPEKVLKHGCGAYALALLLLLAFHFADCAAGTSGGAGSVPCAANRHPAPWPSWAPPRVGLQPRPQPPR